MNEILVGMEFILQLRLNLEKVSMILIFGSENSTGLYSGLDPWIKQMILDLIDPWSSDSVDM